MVLSLEYEQSIVNLLINYNNIIDFREYGVYFEGSPNAIINYNSLKGADNGGWQAGIRNSSEDQLAQVNYNYIELLSEEHAHGLNKYGIIAHDSEVIGDSILLWVNIWNQTQGIGIHADRSAIQNNYVRIFEGGLDDYAIMSYGDDTSNPIILNNKIEAEGTGNASGILASYASIENNNISTWSTWPDGSVTLSGL